MNRRRFIYNAAKGLMLPFAGPIIKAATPIHQTPSRGIVVSGDYTPATAYFVGTTATWMRRDVALWSDGQTFFYSAWVKPDSSSGTTDRLLASNADGVRISLNSSDQVAFTCEDTGGTEIINANSQPTVTRDAATWSHIFIRVNRAVDNQIEIYVNGSVGTGTVITTFTDPPGNAINLDDTSWAIGSDFGFGLEYGGCMADVWVSAGNTYGDIVIGDFYNAGNPIDLGATGTGPDGSQPAIWLKSGNTSFINNSGSGGNFTKQGATDFTDCSTAP